MIRVAPTILCCPLLLLAACQREHTPTPPVPAAEVTASDDQAGIQLALAADRTDITTLDRVKVTITLRRPIAKAVMLIEPDWESTGWTRVGSTDSDPVAIDARRIERSRTVTIEPFLPGDYTIPSAGIQWTTPDLTRTLQTPQLGVTVASVLTPDDTEELDQPASTMPPPARTDDDPLAPLIVSLVVLTGALLAWKATRRPPHTDHDPSPADTIREIANGRHEGQTQLAELHRALAMAEPMPSSKQRLDELIARCETARFSPPGRGPIEPTDPRQLASTALELIVTDPPDNAPGADTTGRDA